MAEPTDRPAVSAVTAARPPHLRMRSLALVFLGGVVGTASREALSHVIPDLDGIPLAILAVNLAGTFVLGLLLESLARRGPDAGARRLVRLLLGTGVLGGFTTYSALAADTAMLFGDGRPGAALLYGLGTVVLGAVASALGIWCGIRAHASRGAAR